MQNRTETFVQEIILFLFCCPFFLTLFSLEFKHTHTHFHHSLLGCTTGPRRGICHWLTLYCVVIQLLFLFTWRDILALMKSCCIHCGSFYDHLQTQYECWSAGEPSVFLAMSCGSSWRSRRAGENRHFTVQMCEFIIRLHMQEEKRIISGKNKAHSFKMQQDFLNK